MALGIKNKLQRLLRYLAADTPFSRHKGVWSSWLLGLSAILAGVAGYLFGLSLDSAIDGILWWFFTVLVALWLSGSLSGACGLLKERHIGYAGVCYVIGNLVLWFWLMALHHAVEGVPVYWEGFFKTPFYVMPWFVIPWLVISAVVPLVLAWTDPWGIKYPDLNVFDIRLIGRMVVLAVIVPMAYFVWYDLREKEAHRWLLIAQRAQSIEFVEMLQELRNRAGLKHESALDRLARKAETVDDVAKAAQYRFLKERERRFEKWLLGDTERLVSELEQLTGERFGELKWSADILKPYEGVYLFLWHCQRAIEGETRPRSRVVWHPPDYDRATVIVKQPPLTEEELKLPERLEAIKGREKGPHFWITSYECRHQIYERVSVVGTILKRLKL